MVEAQATLFHELTHAAAGTKDHAYALEAMAKLGPTRRVDNASHYEHAYLETMQSKDPARYYKPATSIGQSAPDEAQGDTLRGKKVLEAKASLDVIYNLLDNMYLFTQALIEKPDQGTKTIVCQLSRRLAVYPYEQAGKRLDDDVALAMIEDRTRYVAQLSDSDRLAEHAATFSEKKLQKLEPQDLIASIVAKELRLDGAVAETWIEYLLDPRSWSEANL